MNIKGIIFDLDGVIVHTDVYHYRAWKRIADKLGIYFDESINNRLRGVSRAESLDIILQEYSGDITANEKLKLLEEKNKHYKKMLRNMTPADVDDDVNITLHLLKSKGIKLAIGSSSKNAVFILKRAGLLSIFDAISDGNNITKAKPSPEVFLHACEQLHLCPEQCLVVEDAEKGIQAAKAAGMKAAAIGDACKCPYADFKIESVLDILHILEKDDKSSVTDTAISG